MDICLLYRLPVNCPSWWLSLRYPESQAYHVFADHLKFAQLLQYMETRRASMCRIFNQAGCWCTQYQPRQRATVHNVDLLELLTCYVNSVTYTPSCSCMSPVHMQVRSKLGDRAQVERLHKVSSSDCESLTGETCVHYLDTGIATREGCKSVFPFICTCTCKETQLFAMRGAGSTILSISYC